MFLHHSFSDIIVKPVKAIAELGLKTAASLIIKITLLIIFSASFDEKHIRISSRFFFHL